MYVALRCIHPDAATVQLALKKLRENNIDVNQFVEYPMYHCP
jgi:hypothetical protein